jgi:hypothetical protein
MRRRHLLNARRAGAVAVIAIAGLAVASAGRPLHAASGDFTVSPTSLSFPATYVGATSSIPVTVKNVGASTLMPNFAGGAPIDGTNFGGSQNCAGKTFAPGDSCTFTYEFHPASTGSWSSSTTIGIDGDNFALSMSGNALFPFDVAPTTLPFPDTPVGSTSTIGVVVTNISPASQSPNFAGGAPIDGTNFGGSQNCAGKTFAGGDTCTFTYEFHPQSEGDWSSSTTIGVDGENFAISMTGSTGSGTTTTTSSTTSTTSTTSPTTTSPTTTTSSNTATTSAPTSPGPTSPTVPAPTAAPSGPFAPVAPPVGPGHAEVIAQGVVAFPVGPVQWDHQLLDPGGWPFQFASSPPMFLANDGPDGVLVSTDAGSLALLDAGEATFVPGGSSGSATPMRDGEVAAGRRITFVAGLATTSFVPGEGRRDVNLVRDVVAPGETLAVTSPFPLLVVVVDGTVVTAVGGAALAAGTVETAGPSIELRNDSAEPATVLVGAVGGQVP